MTAPRALLLLGDGVRLREGVRPPACCRLWSQTNANNNKPLPPCSAA